MQTSNMQNLINWEAIMPLQRNAGGHHAQLKVLYKGAKILALCSLGDYQGETFVAAKLEDGRYCWYQDSYGSCPGCDAWEDASDEDVRKLCIDLANGTHVFNTKKELIADLKNYPPEDNGLYGGYMSKGMQELLKKLQKKKKKNDILCDNEVS